MKTNLLLAVILFTVTCQSILSQEAVVTSQSATIDETQNLSQNDLRKLQKNLFFPDLRPHNILEPTVTTINFDDLFIPPSSFNTVEISPNRYAGLSFYSNGYNISTWLTRSYSLSGANSLIVGYVCDTSTGHLCSVNNLAIDFAQPSRNVSLWWGRDGTYNSGQIAIFTDNNQHVATVPVSLPGYWTNFSLNQFSERIRRVVLIRPAMPININGHIYLDNFQFEPITTQPPIGNFDSVSIEQAAAVGWSLDPDNPSASNLVDCYIGSTQIGRAIANLPSPDVPYPGNHRFSLPIPYQYRDGNQHTTGCYGLDTGDDGYTTLVGSPKTFRFNTPIGYSDSINEDGDAIGWSLDPDVPLQSNIIHFYFDAPAPWGGTPRGTAIATLPRPDVNQQTGYPGNHGYKYSIPDQYRDGQPHTLYAYGLDLTGDWDKALIGNPKIFTLHRKVKSVTFEQIPNSDPDWSIDENRNIGGGLRIFPDKKHIDDQIDRRIIRVRAKYSSPTPGVRIYFRNFDLDDPSANGPPIDPNFDNGWDNTGSIPEAQGTAGYLSIQPLDGCNSTPGPESTQIVSCLTDANGEVVVDYIVTTRQGDNFAVATSLDAAFLPSVGVNRLDLTHPTSGNVPISGVTPNPCDAPSAMGCRTSMLTVWRRLHIEHDKMGLINTRSGTGVIAATSEVPQGVVQLSVYFGEEVKTDRYQGGSIIIGDRWLPVISSGSGFVVVNNNTSPFNVEVGQSFIIYDDDDFNDNDGDLPRGDYNEEMRFGLETSMLDSVDGECGPGPNPASCNVLAPAYIRPVYDVDGRHQTVPFFEYLVDPDRKTIFEAYFTNIGVHEREDFWVIYLLNAYQPDISDDNDPDYALLFYEPPIRAVSDNLGVALFLELNRPREYEHLDRGIDPGFPRWRNRPVSRAHELARAVGSMFGGDGSDTEGEVGNESLMAPETFRIRGVFGEVTLSKIRTKTFP